VSHLCQRHKSSFPSLVTNWRWSIIWLTHLTVQLYIIQLHMSELIQNAAAKNTKKHAKLSRETPWRHLGWRRYSSYTFLISAIDGGEWSVSITPRPYFTPAERIPRYPSDRKRRRHQKETGRRRWKKKCFASVRNRALVVRSVVRHYTDSSAQAYTKTRKLWYSKVNVLLIFCKAYALQQLL
jgi:hypothetical protein